MKLENTLESFARLEELLASDSDRPHIGISFESDDELIRHHRTVYESAVIKFNKKLNKGEATFHSSTRTVHITSDMIDKYKVSIWLAGLAQPYIFKA